MPTKHKSHPVVVARRREPSLVRLRGETALMSTRVVADAVLLESGIPGINVLANEFRYQEEGRDESPDANPGLDK